MTQEELKTEVHKILLACNNYEDGELSLDKAERKMLHLINAHVKEEKRKAETEFFYKILEEYQPFDEHERLLFRNYMSNLRHMRLRAGIKGEK